MKRSQQLRVFVGDNLHTARVRTFEVRDDVPATRADCPPVACPHIRCRFHLALVECHDRAGRRVDGRTPVATLRPQAFLGEVCALKRAEAYGEQLEPMPIATVADAMGIRQSQVYMILSSAIAKLRAAGLDLEQGEWPRAAGYVHNA